LAVALSAIPALAGWKLSDYNTLAADSAKVNQFYGIQTFANPSSSATLSVLPDSTGNYLRFVASRIASDSTEGYSANVGIIHPLTADWSAMDMRGITSIQFQYRNNKPITDALKVAIGSDAYPQSAVSGQTLYENSITTKAGLAAHSDWVTATLDILDFAPPKWWIPTVDFPDRDSVLKSVKYLQIVPSTLYSSNGTSMGKACTKCVGPTMQEQVLDIRGLTLEGLLVEQPWPRDTIIDTTIVVPPPPPPPVVDTVGYLVSAYANAALDSAKANAIYGVSAYANPASKATVSVPGGYLRFDAPVIASEPATTPNGNGYTANVGLIHPLRADWPTVDLRKLWAIRFKFRNAYKITDNLGVSILSRAYTDEQIRQGTTYDNPVTGVKILAADSVWKTAMLDRLDFAPPMWWTPPADYPSLDSVLSQVIALRIAPTTLYSANGTQMGKVCSRCVGPTMEKQILDIQDIRLLGIDSLRIVPAVEPPPPPSAKDSCQGANVIRLDNFKEESLSTLGGWWYTYSDTGSEIPQDMMQTKGNSRSFITVKPGFAKVEAYLDKTIDEQWIAQAGWAGIATDIHRGFDLKGLKAIQFDLRVDTIYPSVGLILKVHEAGSAVGTSFQAPIPSKTGVVCVSTENLTVSDSVGIRSLNASLIDRFAFEARILDESHPFISQAQAHFSLRDVKLFGADPTLSSKALTKAARKEFGITYQGGVLRMVGIEGMGQVEVRDLHGRKVASFAVASQVPLRLGHGTYILSARRGDLQIHRSFSVMNR